MVCSFLEGKQLQENGENGFFFGLSAMRKLYFGTILPLFAIVTLGSGATEQDEPFCELPTLH